MLADISCPGREALVLKQDVRKESIGSEKPLKLL